jgi:hypothetical protein
MAAGVVSSPDAALYRDPTVPVEQRVVEPGTFRIMVGGNSVDLMEIVLNVAP